MGMRGLGGVCRTVLTTVSLMGGALTVIFDVILLYSK